MNLVIAGPGFMLVTRFACSFICTFEKSCCRMTMIIIAITMMIVVMMTVLLLPLLLLKLPLLLTVRGKRATAPMCS